MNKSNLPINAVYLPTYDDCYVCGQSHSRGLRIRFYTDSTGQVHAQFYPEHSQTGYDDIVHGGVISTLLDELMGWPIALQTGCFSFTAELTVQFKRPMYADQTYLATAFPGVEQGKFWTGSGKICDERGKIYAMAQGKYFLLSTEKTKTVARKMTYQPDDLQIFKAE